MNQSFIEGNSNAWIGLRKFLSWKDPETKEFAESFDHKLLVELFIKKLTQYQVKEFVYLSKEDIKDMRIPGPQIATYHPEQEVIIIDTEKFKETFPQESWNIAFAHTICHEQTHVFSHHVCHDTENNNSNTYVRQVGFEKHTTVTNKEITEVLSKEQVMNFWNEGVTELFAREILLDYVEYKGLQDEYLQYQKNCPPEDKQFYGDNVVEVIKVIEKVAENTGQEKDFVKEAIFRGLFEGEDYMSEEVKNGLDEIFYKGFVRVLSTR